MYSKHVQRLFGYDQGVMSGLLTGRAFTNQFPEIDTTDSGTGSASLQGTVVAIYEIGCLFGSLFTFFYGERFGRRRTIMLGCTVLMIGAAIQTASYGIPQVSRRHIESCFQTLTDRRVLLM
jgi:MFS family permease